MIVSAAQITIEDCSPARAKRGRASRPSLWRGWTSLALAAVVLAAAAQSLIWVFLVPIYQSPDEPCHWDYALCLNQKGGLFRARDIPPPGGINYYVHPFTYYLNHASGVDGVAFTYWAKVPHDYGTRAFYEEIDRNAPSRAGITLDKPPSTLAYYSYGYYGLMALWIEALRLVSDRLTFLFFGSRILSVLLLACTLVFTYGTLREMHFKVRFSLLLTACIGFFPLTSFLSSYIQPDNLAFTLVTVCYYLTLVTRRRQGDLRIVFLLGTALGALFVTKQHFYLCVLVSALAMLVTGPIQPGRSRWRWLATAVLLFLPTLAFGSAYLWTIWGSVPFYTKAAPYHDWLLFWIVGFQDAFYNYYAGSSHDSFWGVFGWQDAPLFIHSVRVTIVVNFVIHLFSWTILALTLLRLQQVVVRLLKVARAGRVKSALRLLCSNPVLNSYYLFTALMFFLFIRTNNGIGAQGRNWFPMLLPAFLVGLVYAPQALTGRWTRSLFSSLATMALVGFVIVGSYYGVQTIKQRYYPPTWGHPVRETPLAVKPVGLERMTWEAGVGTGHGLNPSLHIALPKPEFVYGVRLKYVLTMPAEGWTAMRVWWKRSGQNAFAPEQRTSYSCVKTGSQEGTTTLWINDTIEQFRLCPNWSMVLPHFMPPANDAENLDLDKARCQFKISEMVLLQKPLESVPK